LVTLAAVGFAVLAAFIAVVIALSLTSILLVIIGVGVLLQSIWTGLYYIGCGLLILGIMLTVIPAGIGLLRWLIDKTAQLSKAIYRRFTDKKHMHREDK
jgi:CHASE2 domain-containing sensor protein